LCAAELLCVFEARQNASGIIVSLHINSPRCILSLPHTVELPEDRSANDKIHSLCVHSNGTGIIGTCCDVREEAILEVWVLLEVCFWSNFWFWLTNQVMPPFTELNRNWISSTELMPSVMHQGITPASGQTIRVFDQKGRNANKIQAFPERPSILSIHPQSTNMHCNI